MIARLRSDQGSVIPLILGCWLVVALMVAGYVAATNAFAKRVDLQSVCDGAAIAAANSPDFAGERTVGGGESDGALRLDDVQGAVSAYLSRDPWRESVEVDTQLSDDRTRVLLRCQRRSKIAFGRLFGKPNGVVATVTSSARSTLLVGG